MDLTYFVALGLALIVGFTGALIFVARQGHSKRRLLGWATLVSVIVDFAFLIDWTRVSEFPIALLALDLVFFTLYGVIGCALGILPVLAVRKALRRTD